MRLAHTNRVHSGAPSRMHVLLCNHSPVMLLPDIGCNIRLEYSMTVGDHTVFQVRAEVVDDNRALSALCPIHPVLLAPLRLLQSCVAVLVISVCT